MGPLFLLLQLAPLQLLNPVMIPLPGKLSHIALNCHETLLCVCLKHSKSPQAPLALYCMVYNLETLYTGEVGIGGIMICIHVCMQ